MTYPQLAWTLVVAVFCSALFWRVCRSERQRILAAWVLIILAVAFRIVSGQFNIPWLGELARAFGELAAVQIFTIFIFQILLGRLPLPLIARDLAVGVAYVAIVFRLLSRLGTDVNGLIATSTVVTAIIGLSMQDMLVNSVGGVVLQLEREIAHGDYIRTDQGSGWVRRVRTRYTAIETSDSDVILIPNNLLTKGAVTLVSKSHRILLNFNLAYEHLPTSITRNVEEALRASSISGVASEPRPLCIVTNLHSGHIEYGVLVWLTNPGRHHEAVSEILTRVYFGLARAGAPLVSISHRVDLGGEQPQVSSDKNRELGIAALRRNEIFRTFTADELQLLALRLRHVSFAPGETIVRQGDQGESLFIVVKGKLRVLLSAADGRSEQVALLEPGSLFGEMSLLTGDRRSASVVAADQVDCDRLDKADFAEVLLKRPQLAEQISQYVSDRQIGLAEVRERLNSTPLEDPGKDLLARIQDFFGLS